MPDTTHDSDELLTLIVPAHVYERLEAMGRESRMAIEDVALGVLVDSTRSTEVVVKRSPP